MCQITLFTYGKICKFILADFSSADMAKAIDNQIIRPATHCILISGMQFQKMNKTLYLFLIIDYHFQQAEKLLIHIHSVKFAFSTSNAITNLGSFSTEFSSASLTFSKTVQNGVHFYLLFITTVKLGFKNFFCQSHFGS